MIIVAPLTHAAEATIWTDKPDYCPEETVTISGSGFLASATVTVTITRPDSIVDMIYASADESGAFTCNYQLDGITGTYAVTATDGTNTALTTFTDTMKYFTSTISPTTANTGQTQTYTITITNDLSSSGGAKLGSATISIPSGFTSVSITSVTASAGKSWTATVVSGKIKLTANSNSDRLNEGEHVSVSFSATAPALAGTYVWTTTAYTNPSWSGDLFYLVGSQPQVIVSAATVSITITSSPVTGADFVKVDSSAITTPHTFTWTLGDTHNLKALSPVADGAGTQYVYTNWSDGGTQTHTYTVPSTSQTVTANYKTQYYLTVVSPYDTAGGIDWYDLGATAYATLATGTVDIVPGWVKAVFTGWSGDASGTGLTSDPITMNGPKTAIANWEIQYYLSVVTDPSTLPPIPGADWYPNCTWVRLTAPQYVPSEADLNGVRYSFTFWDVDGTSQGTGVNPIDVHMDALHIATAHFVLQYYLTVQTSPPGVDSPTGEGWYDAGTYAPISTDQYFDIVPGSSRYNFTGWATTDMSEIISPTSLSTTVLMDKAKTVTANYVTQYYVAFAQTGVGSDFTGTMVIIDGTGYDRNGASFWWDSGSTHSFAFQSPLIVPPGAKQYDWDSTTGLSSLQTDPIYVTGSGGVTGNYVTHVHDVAVTDIVAVVPHCASKVGNDLWVFQGRPVYFNVTILNKGDFDETVTVTLYYNITANRIIGTQDTTLLIGESKTLLFVWNTANVPYCHNYTITAVATIPADYTPADNTRYDGSIKVRILGDINGDGTVDGSDLIIVARAFGSYGPNYMGPGSPPHPRWNLDSDINEDNVVDGSDLVVVCRNFGMCAQGY